MKYLVNFSFTVVKASKKLGLCFQGMKAETELLSEQPLNIDDPEIRVQIEDLLVADITRQGYSVIRNMFKIESFTTLSVFSNL
jgi:hypothetical protein